MVFIQNGSDKKINNFRVLSSNLQERVNAGKAHSCARHFSEKEIKYISKLLYKLTGVFVNSSGKSAIMSCSYGFVFRCLKGQLFLKFSLIFISFIVNQIITLYGSLFFSLFVQLYLSHATRTCRKQKLKQSSQSIITQHRNSRKIGIV